MLNLVGIFFLLLLLFLVNSNDNSKFRSHLIFSGSDKEFRGWKRKDNCQKRMMSDVVFFRGPGRQASRATGWAMLISEGSNCWVLHREMPSDLRTKILALSKWKLALPGMPYLIASFLTQSVLNFTTLEFCYVSWWEAIWLDKKS